MEGRLICLTGAERSVAQLASRLQAHPDMMHELRIDALDDVDDDLFALIEAHACRLLACCRPVRQGGAFDGDESERLALLIRAQQSPGCRVDVEDDVAELSAFDPSRLVLSFHDFGAMPDDLVARARAMRPRAAVVKIAAAAADVAELAALREVRRAIDGDAVLIGMGAAGMLSRTHYAAFGSAWTYVPADPSLATAPGQIDLARARILGLPASASQPFMALVGGEQVLHSPGPVVYSRLLRDEQQSYVPVVARSLAEALPLLDELGAYGLSVTMPHKRDAMTLTQPDALGRELGAVNSLRRDADGWHSTNSDVTGVRAPLSGKTLSRALILGAGGAARAAARACRELKIGVTVAARTPDAARAFCDDVVAWSDRKTVPCDLLINATPIAGDDSPWPAPVTASVVFDLAIAPRSKLLEDARHAGCETIDATEMWLHQGAEQMRFILRRDITADRLRELLP